MSLVAYGSSDESDSEETNCVINSRNGDLPEDNTVSSTNIAAEKNSRLNGSEIKCSVKNESSESGTNLFSKLPSPKYAFSMPDNTFKLLNKKQPVKIVLPSLSEIKVDEDEMKKRKPSTKGSGLFALLPAPKNVSSLVPNVVKNKTVAQKIVPKTLHPLKKPPISSLSNNKKLDNDDEEDSEQPESFFFNSADVKPDEMLPVDIPEISLKSMFDHTNSSTPSSSGNAIESFNQPVTVMAHDGISPSGFPDTNNSTINDEAIEKLCGVGAKKRKGMPDEIIDINVDSIVGDAYMWLSKDLTVEQEHKSFKKPKNLSVVERRKHQITYLASQAKEKELELKNQWANNRMTRKQTQSKYGF